MKMISKRATGALALAAAAALVLSSCSSSAEEPKTDGGGSTDALQIATLLPQTGSLGFLMPPVQAGIAQALADINGAGGVLGQDVTIVAEGNEGDATELTVVEKGADDVIKSGASFVLGAMGSGRSAHVVDKIAEAGILMGSPSNTIPAERQPGVSRGSTGSSGRRIRSSMSSPRTTSRSPVATKPARS